MFTLNVLQFRGDKIAKEYLYVMEGFEAADWRTTWATVFDPLASVRPTDWRAEDTFGLESEQLRTGDIPGH